MRDLHRYIVQQYAANWDSLGLELGLERFHIDNITRDNRCVAACCKEMLNKWLQIDASATWGKLDDAIRVITATPEPVIHENRGT